MKRQQAVIPLLLVLLLAVASQAKEEFKVSIDGQRNATVVISTDDGEKGLDGTIKASADLTKAESAIDVNLNIEDAKEFGDGTLLAHLQMTGERMEMIGSVDMPIPPGGDAPEVFDVSVESVTEKDHQTAEVAMKIVAPSPEQIPTIAIGGDFNGSTKTLVTNINYSIEGEAADLGEIPFSKFDLAISDQEDLTTIALTMAAPSDSQFASQLKMLPQAKGMLEQQFQQANITVEKIEFPPSEDADGQTVQKGTIVLKGLRTTLNGLIDAFGPNMGSPEIDAQAVMQILKGIVAVRTNKFEFSMNVNGGKVEGAVVMDLTDLEKFYQAYIDAMPAFMEMAYAQQGYRELGEFAGAFEAFQKINLENGLQMVKIMMETDIGFEGEGSFGMSTPAEGKMSLETSLNMKTNNYQQFMAKAKEAGFPVAEKALVLGNVEFKEGRLVGDGYIFTDGEMLKYYKSMLVAALAQAGKAEVEEIVKGLEVKESRVDLTLKGQQLTIKGFSETSDLTQLSAAIMKNVAPQVEGTLVGAKMDFTFKPDGTGEGQPVALYFKEFMPGKSADDVKKALALPAAATVEEGGEVATVTVERPEVNIDPKLTSIQKTALARFSTATTTASGETVGGSGGSKTWMLVVGGLVVLGLIGFGLASGKKE